MKTALALIAFAVLTSVASGVEYVTLNVAGPDASELGPQERSKALSPSSLVEIVGVGGENNSSLTAEFTKSDGSMFRHSIVVHSDVDGAPGRGPGQVTDVTQIRLLFEGPHAAANGFITLKITSATEINAVTPSAVLVLPENSTGNFDVIIEASDDLLTWSPFFSQTVNSATATRFFRTRVTRTPAPTP